MVEKKELYCGSSSKANISACSSTSLHALTPRNKEPQSVSEKNLSFFSQNFTELVSELKKIKIPTHKSPKRKTISKPSFVVYGNHSLRIILHLLLSVIVYIFHQRRNIYLRKKKGLVIFTNILRIV